MYDTSASFNEAMDLRDILESLSENNETIQRLERKEILEKLEKQKRKIMEKSNKQFLRAYNQLKRNPDVKSEKYQETLEALKELLRKRD